MNVKFRMVMDLETEIDDTPLSELDPQAPEYESMELFKTFILELIKHPEALREYYRNMVVEDFIQLDNDEIDTIKEQLDYQMDYKRLFRQVAEECPSHVKYFIFNLYPPMDMNDHEPNGRELLRDRVEEHFGSLKVLSTEFMVVPPKEENGETG